jgi:hypothetical protein
MKNTYTPHEAIVLVNNLTGLTSQQYHEIFVEAGTAHAQDVIDRLMPGNHDIKDRLLKDVLTLRHVNFWAYFQNVVYLKNLRLIEQFGEIVPAEKHLPEFHLKVWANMLAPSRLRSYPSPNFERIVSALIKGYMIYSYAKEGNSYA